MGRLLDRSTSRRSLALAAIVVVLLAVAPVWGSMFGEENTTLVQMLVQLFEVEQQMQDLNETAGQLADTTKNLLATYEQVNAGIDTIKGYSFDGLLTDLRTDVYNQYPGFAKLANASVRLGTWEK